MTTHRSRTLLAIALALVAGGCKQAAKPEHELLAEKKKQEQARVAARARGVDAGGPGPRGGGAHPGGEDHAHDHGEAGEDRGHGERPGFSNQDGGVPPALWPTEVQRAYGDLYRAAPSEMPLLARRLALLGLPAVPAMRQLIRTKRQPPKKKAALSFLLVELYAFRPAELAKLALEGEMPLAQHAAIDALGRLKNKEATQLLAALKKDVEPLAEVVEVARRRPGWNLTPKQVAALDAILHAASAAELKELLDKLSGLELRDGLLHIVRSAATRPPVAALVAERLAALAEGKPGELHAMSVPPYPAILRLKVAQRLLARGRPADRAYLAKLADTSGDPLAPMLKRLLSGGGQ